MKNRDRRRNNNEERRFNTNLTGNNSGIDTRQQSYHSQVQIRKKMYHEIKELDRTEQCPFLVRIFYAINDENNYKNPPINTTNPITSSATTTALLPTDRELKIHLW
jgi:hypothetical protein